MTFDLQQRLVSITQSERNPRFHTYRDQVPEDVSDSAIYRALRHLVEQEILVKCGPAGRRWWNLVTNRERFE